MKTFFGRVLVISITFLVLTACNESGDIDQNVSSDFSKKSIADKTKGRYTESYGIHVTNYSGSTHYFYLKDSTAGVWLWYEEPITNNSLKRQASIVAGHVYQIYAACGAVSCKFKVSYQYDSHYVEYEGSPEYLNYVSGGATYVVEDDTAPGPCLP